MHSPSLLTPVVAAEIIGDARAEAARSRRARPSAFGARVLRLGRRPDALRSAVSRGRPAPPVTG